MLSFTSLKLRDVATIGSGSFGRVDLAWSDVEEQYYAVKKYNIHETVEESRVEYVKREKELLSIISSPFIVQLICTHMDKTNLYIVMEFVHGGELINYLDDITDEVLNNTARFYSMEIICALQHIHSKNIAYRDLKPENLLLTQNGHIKLSDFGLAKRIKGKTYTICGTIEYIAPEVFMKKGYDVNVDWWSLGVLIFELFTGNPPFCGDNNELIDAICKASVDIPESVPDSVRRLILSLLNRDPSQRALNITNQKWFDNIDWDEVRCLAIQPPIIPSEFDVNEMAPVVKITDAVDSVQRERDLFADWDEVLPAEADRT
ncbi:kinase domain protein [Dictyocaulus viviparus]|uniref:Kinase domain protein n=1 Tax=Dictyocaulus viviparus TaxID=29172 RepID=A0A0D8XF55_DICVI|nr:kinase domain protein [Dictyocaulus viviparus]